METQQWSSTWTTTGHKKTHLDLVQVNLPPTFSVSTRFLCNDDHACVTMEVHACTRPAYLMIAAFMTSVAQEAEQTKGSQAWSAAAVTISTSQPGGEGAADSAMRLHSEHVCEHTAGCRRWAAAFSQALRFELSWNDNSNECLQGTFCFFASVHVLKMFCSLKDQCGGCSGI